MPTDKLLHRIQVQIDELAPTLELFVDSNVQPSVQDCDTLQKQLVMLMENIAVYKYDKQNKELSPSFNLHVKLSAKEHEEENNKAPLQESIAPAAPVHETVKDIKPVIHTNPDAEDSKEPPAPTVQNSGEEPPKTKTPLVIGINDKFRFINELFSQNSAEYHIAIEQINNVKSWNEADIYLNSLKNVYEWDENKEVVTYFFALVRRRFD